MRIRILGFAAACAAGSVAGAQASPIGIRHAVITGVVTDSLRGGALGGATVVVIGAERKTVTNARGEFLLDSVAPGDVRLGVRHALMDTLGLTLLSEIVHVNGGQHVQVQIQTATLASVRERVCPRGGALAGQAMLVGRVLEADTDAPFANASVSLVYTDSANGQPRERVRQARTKDDGSYAICNLPETMTGTVQAQLGGRSTAEVPVTSALQVLSTASLTFGSGTDSVAVLEGRVTARGQPVAEVQVALTGTPRLALTRADGTFSMTNLPSGTQAVVIRKLGFAAVTRAVALTRRAPQQITVALQPAQTLAAVRVEGKLDAGLANSGFLYRQRIGQGQYMGPDEVDRRKPELVTDLLQTLNGFRVVAVSGGRTIIPTRASTGMGDNCLNVYIDRTIFQIMTPGDLDQMVRGGDIGAVEAYPSPTNVPPEFQTAGKSCAAIVLWTRYKLGKP